VNIDVTFTERPNVHHNPDKQRDARLTDIRRLEATFEAPDGQQYKAMLLDADDSYDIVVVSPNSEREIVWSLIKEAPTEGELTVTQFNCSTCDQPVWSDGSCSQNCPRNGEHEAAA